MPFSSKLLFSSIPMAIDAGCGRREHRWALKPSLHVSEAVSLGQQCLARCFLNGNTHGRTCTHTERKQLSLWSGPNRRLLR